MGPALAVGAGEPRTVPAGYLRPVSVVSDADNRPGKTGQGHVVCPGCTGTEMGEFENTGHPPATPVLHAPAWKRDPSEPSPGQGCAEYRSVSFRTQNRYPGLL